MGKANRLCIAIALQMIERARHEHALEGSRHVPLKDAGRGVGVHNRLIGFRVDGPRQQKTRFLQAIHGTAERAFDDAALLGRLRRGECVTRIQIRVAEPQIQFAVVLLAARFRDVGNVRAPGA